MLLGLDDFSRINSLNDHSFGNTVLRHFAQTLQRLLPETPPRSARRRQFAVIARRADRGAMKDLYRRRPHGGEPPAHHRRRDVLLHGIGRASRMVGEDGTTGLDLVAHAESALEESKHRGKNTSTFYSSGDDRREAQPARDQRPPASVGRGGMRDFSSCTTSRSWMRKPGPRRRRGVAALERERSRLLTPVEFIPVLESYGLIGPWAVGCSSRPWASARVGPHRSPTSSWT